VRPMVEERGLPWEAVEGLIDDMHNKETLEAAIVDPEEFLKDATLTFTLNVIVHKLKAKLKPLCISKGLPWPVIENQIDTLDTVEELQAALEDFETWMENAFNAALATLIEILSERLKPMVEAKGLPWVLVQGPVSKLDTLAEIMDAFSDLNGFLTTIFAALADVLLGVLKEQLELVCEQTGLPWVLVEPVVDELDDTEKIKGALADHDGFLQKVFAGSLSALMTLLKSKVQVYCLKVGLPFEPIEPAFDEIDTPE